MNATARPENLRDQGRNQFVTFRHQDLTYRFSVRSLQSIATTATCSLSAAVIQSLLPRAITVVVLWGPEIQKLDIHDRCVGSIYLVDQLDSPEVLLVYDPRMLKSAWVEIGPQC